VTVIVLTQLQHITRNSSCESCSLFSRNDEQAVLGLWTF